MIRASGYLLIVISMCGVPAMASVLAQVDPGSMWIQGGIGLALLGGLLGGLKLVTKQRDEFQERLVEAYEEAVKVARSHATELSERDAKMQKFLESALAEFKERLERLETEMTD